jgi:hypothetical protein
VGDSRARSTAYSYNPSRDQVPAGATPLVTPTAGSIASDRIRRFATESISDAREPVSSISNIISSRTARCRRGKLGRLTASLYWSSGPQGTVPLIKGARAVAAVIEHASHKVSGFPGRACVCCECRFDFSRAVKRFCFDFEDSETQDAFREVGSSKNLQIRANWPSQSHCSAISKSTLMSS